MKSEVEVYLEEELALTGHGKNFEILLWWKEETVEFRVLSKRAHDILAIPISTITCENAFSLTVNIIVH